MLVLGRKVGEKIKIGEDITVVIAEVTSGGLVKLGFSAPEDIVIDREEVYLKKRGQYADQASILHS